MSITREQLNQPGAVFRAKLNEAPYCMAGYKVTRPATNTAAQG